MCPAKRTRLPPRTRLDLTRRTDAREPRPYILIVCEGTKTEPQYFKGFRLTNAVVKVRPTGKDTVDVVHEADRLRNDREEGYDQVWCVFDRDSFPPQRFLDALRLAGSLGIEVAYSNACFEVWFLLHFYDHTASLTPHDCCQKLSKLMGQPYMKGRLGIYDLLQKQQPDAVKRAERLLCGCSPPRPESDNPSTTVHLLVKELNRFLR